MNFLNEIFFRCKKISKHASNFIFWYSQLLDVRLFWLDSPNKVELQRVLFFAIFGFVYSKFQAFFQFFRVFISLRWQFFRIFFVFPSLNIVPLSKNIQKPWSHFQLLKGKIRFEIPKPRQDPPSHYQCSILFWSPRDALDYFVFNRDKLELAMVSRIMSCRHVTTIGN